MVMPNYHLPGIYLPARYIAGSLYVGMYQVGIYKVGICQVDICLYVPHILRLAPLSSSAFDVITIISQLFHLSFI